MTENQSVNQQENQENKLSDKEINFRTLEAKYKRELEQQRLAVEQERQARLELENQMKKIHSSFEEDEDSDEPYVDHKKLDKKLSKFEKKLEERFDKKVDERAKALLDKKEEEDWLKSNKDFIEVMNEDNLTKFLNRAPGMAESIKRMPDGFEKQKLVYNAIKSMGIDKPEQKQSSIQEKIDANRRNPYYQPSGVASAPYSSAGDFSPSGQKNAYNKMKELQAKLRM
jgi:hypothetical protein